MGACIGGGGRLITGILFFLASIDGPTYGGLQPGCGTTEPPLPLDDHTKAKDGDCTFYHNILRAEHNQ